MIGFSLQLSVALHKNMSFYLAVKLILRQDILELANSGKSEEKRKHAERQRGRVVISDFLLKKISIGIFKNATN